MYDNGTKNSTAAYVTLTQVTWVDTAAPYGIGIMSSGETGDFASSGKVPLRPDLGVYDNE